MKDTPTLTTIIHDGTALETTDAGARVIDELKAELITKDKELGARDAEIVRLKDEMKAVGDIDRLVAERADVIARARTIADHVEVTGLASPEIRRAAVAARLGETTVAERSDDYVEALFDSLVADADPLTDALRLTPAPAAGDPYRAYTERLANAWKMKEAH